ncbi:MAG: RsmE family RNA methyltransferase [Ignavibacteriales bacterium]|nr:RsmE family RNA methyltransferase [Ignavibacteriales bacterium]
MNSGSLSNIELYYSPNENIFRDKIVILGEECNHIVNVMRHSIGDDIYVSNGEGKIYNCIITIIEKSKVSCEIKNILPFENRLSNIFFCIPKLKSQDRFEFALEKCVELGITNFIIYPARNSIIKGNKLDRWQKILLSAMKQSLRSYLPKINIVDSFEQIIKLGNNVVIFEQNSNKSISSLDLNSELNYYFIFGPEGGLDLNEIRLIDPENIYHLGQNRLRTETAILKVASYLSLKQ